MVELKGGEFQPEHVGKLNFYLSAVDTQRDFQTELAQARLLQRFVLRTSLASASKILQPILDAVERHPKETGQILDGLIYANDSNPNTPQRSGRETTRSYFVFALPGLLAAALARRCSL